jgi:small GTP-binding protein
MNQAIHDNKRNLTNLRSTLLRSGLNNLDWPANKSAKIVVLGLTGAGKSTLIEFLQKGSVETQKRRPTLAFSFHQCDFGKIKAVFVDVPGQESYWTNWASYMKGADGVIFVIDGTKLSDIAKAYSVYLKTMQSSQHVPVAILANKQDLTGALSADSISRMMSIYNGSMITKSFDTIAITGDGLHDALVWLLQTSNSKFLSQGQ